MSSNAFNDLERDYNANFHYQLQVQHERQAMTGIYGNHPEDRARERELNRYLDSQNEWSDADKKKAKEELFDAITWNGEVWDESLEGYRLEMFYEWENIMCSRLASSEKIVELNDIQNKYVKLYCEDAVERDPCKYCELYCLDDE